MAASWVWGDDHEIIAFCEIDKFCQKVLKKHWPEVPIFEDIKELNYEKIVEKSYRSNGGCEARDSIHKRRTSCKNWGTCLSEITERENDLTISDDKSANINGKPTGDSDFTVDLITGGFPCQPFSVAGKRKGKEDDRALWPEYLRIIQEVRPRWIIGENVSGIINMELDTVLSDLEGEGYSCQTLVIPACAVNAPHRRDRVWIVANNDSLRYKHGELSSTKTNESGDKSFSRIERCICHAPNPEGRESREPSEPKGREDIGRGSGWDEPWLEVATHLCRVDDGIPRKLDRVNRLKALGNAIVPQVVYPIMKAIKEIEEI